MLQNFDLDRFLADHWQKKPLLIRKAFADWTNPIDPDELAGLACEEEVEARLIEAKKSGWALEHGPFTAKRFAKLGKKPWTLLVQAVDQVAPDVAALMDPFRFVPNWRIDDVMVSYASDGGGVRPHFDQYDVFLIQGLGRRRWRVGQQCDAASPLLPHDDLRLLADFHATDEWVLEPGDILYVPPGVAHDGVAVGDDCMTYSIGFRAPSRGDLIDGWCDHLVDTLVEDDRYADPDLKPQANPGEIAPAALDRLHAMVTQALTDRAAFARWFGAHATTAKYPEADWSPDETVDAADVRALLTEGAALERNPASRFAYVAQPEGVTLFVDGESFDCAGEVARFAQNLCAYGPIGDVPTEALPLLAALLNQGSLILEADDA